MKKVVTLQGNKIVVAVYPERRVSATVRGKCTEYTDRSRRGLLDAINRAVYRSATMVTLTFHENLQDKSTALGFVRAWVKRLYRQYGKFGYFWRVERQEPQAPQPEFWPHRLQWR